MSECDKWAEVVNDARVIHEFSEFLSSKGMIICEVFGEGYIPVRESVQDLIYKHFDIDYKKLEKERRDLLAEVQNFKKNKELSL